MEHPLSLFKFCPKCGSLDFVINNEKSKRCQCCGFVYYFNPSAATVAVIQNQRGDLLVCRRAKDPAKGMLDLPGGFVDMYETGDESVKREVYEETGLIVKTTKYLFSIPNLYEFSGFLVHTLDLFYLCNVDCEEKLLARDDVAETFFVKVADINDCDFGLLSIRKGVKKLIEKGYLSKKE